jgi:hypothetical protein
MPFEPIKESNISLTIATKNFLDLLVGIYSISTTSPVDFILGIVIMSWSPDILLCIGATLKLFLVLRKVQRLVLHFRCIFDLQNFFYFHLFDFPGQDAIFNIPKP